MLDVLCSGAIIANSSFSWWGAWLQNNRGKVIAPDPKKWFGSAMTFRYIRYSS